MNKLAGYQMYFLLSSFKGVLEHPRLKNERKCNPFKEQKYWIPKRFSNFKCTNSKRLFKFWLVLQSQPWAREKSVKQISCFSHFLIWCCLLKSISVKDNDGDDDAGEIIRGCHPLANDFQLKGCIDIVTESGVSNGTLLTGNEAR